MNSADNGFAPFQIDVNYLKPGDEGGSMNAPAIPCNQSIPGGDGELLLFSGDLFLHHEPDFST